MCPHGNQLYRPLLIRTQFLPCEGSNPWPHLNITVLLQDPFQNTVTLQTGYQHKHFERCCTVRSKAQRELMNITGKSSGSRPVCQGNVYKSPCGGTVMPWGGGNLKDEHGWQRTDVSECGPLLGSGRVMHVWDQQVMSIDGDQVHRLSLVQSTGGVHLR